MLQLTTMIDLTCFFVFFILGLTICPVVNFVVLHCHKNSNLLFHPRFSLILWKCLDYRSGFGHQIAAALAACYIAFFSLLRFKYGTLTYQISSPDSVLESVHTYRPES